MNDSVAIIIPFYQTEPGVLRRSILSVIKQKKVPAPFEAIVVDDGSPIRAVDELKQIRREVPGLIRIVEQKNEGPGSARNNGLRNIKPNTKFVAFLDSDDSWRENHLENALFALARGYDFYFADFMFSDFQEKSAFHRANRLQMTTHKLLDSSRSLFEYLGDMFDQILLIGNVIGTSTVVYRYGKHPNLRFREEFFNGQDYLFWLDCWHEGLRKIVFSTQVECDYGSGINIYSGAKWGSDRLLLRLRNELKQWRAVEQIYELTEPQQDGNNRRKKRILEETVRDLLRRIRRAERVPVSLLAEMFRLDPKLVSTTPIVMARILFEGIPKRN
jgi:succinoglycan biosynthesis protein ExoW